MSQENVEVARRRYDAVGRGDLQTVLALYDPELSPSSPSEDEGERAALRWTGLWTVEDGRITHVAWHATRKDALEAAGLRE